MSAPSVQAQPQSPAAANTAATRQAVTVAVPKGRRFLFLDNLRILLICSVLVQHLTITYGATGSWYFRDPVSDTFTGTFLLLWSAPAMAAGMGLFFLIAGYFTPGSYDRKGVRAFLRDRLVRLGIPLVVWVLLCDPLVDYVGNGLPGSYWSYYGRYLLHLRGVTGPVWFLAVLLIFTLLYAAWRELTRHRWSVPDWLVRLPSYGVILGFILGLGLVTFAVRIWWPVTVIFVPLNAPVGYLPQYASMFVVGLLAYRGDWFSKFSARMARQWATAALCAYVTWAVPAIPIMASGAGRSGDDPGTMVAGGIHVLAFSYAMWEPFILVGTGIALLVLFRDRLNRQGPLAAEASASAYAVYLIHPLVLVSFCYAFAPVALYPLLKFVIAVLITVPLCFLLSSGLRRIPVLNKAL